MRYLVRAKVKPGKAADLRQAIEDGTLGQGSMAGGEYLRDMAQARLVEDGSVRWVEVCYCRIPLEEERPYWEEYFELTRVQDAHDRRRCRDLNGEEWWACSTCDCTEKFEARLAEQGQSFLEVLSEEVLEKDRQPPDCLLAKAEQRALLGYTHLTFILR